MPRILIADELNSRAVEVLCKRGVETDVYTQLAPGKPAVAASASYLAAERQASLAKALADHLESAETADLVAMLPWLDFAYAALRADSA
jgi:hypothetical protein